MRTYDPHGRDRADWNFRFKKTRPDKFYGPWTVPHKAWEVYWRPTDEFLGYVTCAREPWIVEVSPGVRMRHGFQNPWRARNERGALVPVIWGDRGSRRYSYDFGRRADAAQALARRVGVMPPHLLTA